MYLRIVGSEELLFDGDIYGFTSNALDGNITFLEDHEDYITVLKKGDLGLIDTKGEKPKRKITLREDSLLLVEGNRAMVFC